MIERSAVRLGPYQGAAYLLLVTLLVVALLVDLRVALLAGVALAEVRLVALASVAVEGHCSHVGGLLQPRLPRHQAAARRVPHLRHVRRPSGRHPGLTPRCPRTIGAGRGRRRTANPCWPRWASSSVTSC